MARTVHCSRYHEELEGLPAPPFPGPKGEEIYNSVSRKAWEEWTRHQTMLINERHLNLMDADARRYLEAQRDSFLAGESVDAAEGYVPPSEE